MEAAEHIERAEAIVESAEQAIDMLYPPDKTGPHPFDRDVLELIRTRVALGSMHIELARWKTGR